MNSHCCFSRLGIIVVAAGFGAFAPNAAAQGGWESAVALGTYAVYGVDREIGGLATQGVYFFQTFNPDGTVAIFNFVTNDPPAAEGERRVVTVKDWVCEGTYTAHPRAIHQTTCGDDTLDLLVLVTDQVDGRSVVTAVRSASRVFGSNAGEAFQYEYRLLSWPL